MRVLRPLMQNRRATILLTTVGAVVLLMVFGFFIHMLLATNIDRSHYIGETQLQVIEAAVKADEAILYASTALAHAATEAAVLLAAGSGHYAAGEEAEDPEEFPCGTFFSPLWSTSEQTCPPPVRAAFARYTQDALDTYLAGLFVAYPASQYVLAVHDAGALSRVDATATTQLKIPIAASKAGLHAPPGRGPVQYGDLRWPTDTSTITITSCFGPRTLGGSGYHYGLDQGLPDGTPIVAAGAGTVVKTCERWVGPCQCSSLRGNCPRQCLTTPPMCGNYGNYVLLKHNENLYTQYNHLSGIPDEIVDGATVAAGQVIGASGSTGRSTGGHLDLKVFDSAAGRFASNTAKNPVCFFGGEVLSRMHSGGGNNCQKNFGAEPFRLDNPRVARDCAAVSLDTRLPPDEEPAPPLDQPPEAPPPGTLNAEWVARIERFDAQIRAAADQEGIPPGIIKAMLYHESRGDPNAISISGAAGGMQITATRARDHRDIFRRITVCCGREGDEDLYTACKFERRCCGTQAWCAGCGFRCEEGNDDRLGDAGMAKSIEAMAKDFGDDFRDFERNLLLLAIAHNAGRGIATRIHKMRDCKPLVLGNLRRCLEAAYATDNDLTGAQKQARVREAFTHAVKFSEAFAAFGGGHTISMQGETGYYAIWPHLSTFVANPFAPYEYLGGWVEDTWTACGTAADPDACVADRIAAANAEDAPVTLSADCGGTLNIAFKDLAETLERCRTSTAEGCVCDWQPAAIPELAGDADAYGVFHLIQEGGTLRLSMTRALTKDLGQAAHFPLRLTLAETPTAEARPVADLNYYAYLDGQGRTETTRLEIPEPYESWEDYVLQLLRTSAEELVLVHDAGEAPPCPLPRNTYRVCAATRAAWPMLRGTGDRAELSRAPLTIPVAFTLRDRVAPPVPAGAAYHWVLPDGSERWGIKLDAARPADLFKYTVSWAGDGAGSADLYPTRLRPHAVSEPCASPSTPLDATQASGLEVGTGYTVMQPPCPDAIYYVLAQPATSFMVAVADHAGNTAEGPSLSLTDVN